MTAPQFKKFALLSVTDKTGIVALAKGLQELGFGILSTGGTAKALREASIEVIDVATYTGSPEILDGRVKTLHPKVHGAILFDRSNPDHCKQAVEQGIGTIDLVAVNLYNFAGKALAQKLSKDQAIEHIDVGGPTMIRAAAKNWMHTLAVIDPIDYETVLERLKSKTDDREFRLNLSAKVFKMVAAYDGMIASYLSTTEGNDEGLAPVINLTLERGNTLRYGENPQQKAGVYTSVGPAKSGFGATDFLQGKELSYNNILDLDAATALVREFKDPAIAIIKHTNPCGLALAQGNESLAATFKRALSCDPKSAFGGIVAINRNVDKETAEGICSLFTECVSAPGYSPEALEVFKSKANLRVIVTKPHLSQGSALQVRSVDGAFLVQTLDQEPVLNETWSVVTSKKPDDREYRDLQIGMVIAKHVKSNAIAYIKDSAIVGVGAGQMSRIDAAKFGAEKAKEHGHDLNGAIMASDAFFPFSDTVEFANALGIRSIVQPGGSKRDQESIDAANKLGISMVFTGQRHFRH